MSVCTDQEQQDGGQCTSLLKALHKACPIRITKILTDNGKKFTDRLFASREREPSGGHVFDQTCQQFDIEYRLIKPRTPRTNGMVERFNGRIADVLKTHRFNNQEDLTQTLHRYVYLYNHELPQSALHSKTPQQTMCAWYDQKSELFNKKPVASIAGNRYPIVRDSTPAPDGFMPRWHHHRIGSSQRHEAIEQAHAHMHLHHLTLKGSRHKALTQALEAMHLALYQAAAVVVAAGDGFRRALPPP
jgi:hypothetical protein